MITLEEAIKQLKDRSVINLNLSEDYIGAEGIRAIAMMLKTNTTLISLDLKYNRIVDMLAADIA